MPEEELAARARGESPRKSLAMADTVVPIGPDGGGVDIPPPPDGGGDEPPPPVHDNPDPECPIENEIGATVPVGTLPDSFSVGHDGSAQLSIPLEVAPGPRGMEPRLALSYNSRLGHGPLGAGWHISGLSAIRRVPKSWAVDRIVAPVRYDETDRFAIDGERLVAVQGIYGADQTEYRTERETFDKIVSYGSDFDRRFRVWTKAGLLLDYGTTEDSRVGYPADRVAHHHSYLLSKITDRAGNTIQFFYGRPIFRVEQGQPLDYWLDRIDYGGNQLAGRAPGRRVQFHYVPDEIAGYVGYYDGIFAPNLRRIQSIEVQAPPFFQLVRRYELTYEFNEQVRKALLSQVQEFAADGVGKPPTRLAYALFQLIEQQSALARPYSPDPPDFWDGAPPSRLDFEKARWPVAADLDGNGTDDVIYPWSGHWVVQLGTWGRNLGGAIDTLVNVDVLNGFDADPPHPPYFFQPKPFDYDNDGKADLLVLQRNNGAGPFRAVVLTWNGATFLTRETGISFREQALLAMDLLPTPADIDGDGRADLVYSGEDHLLRYRVLRNGGFSDEAQTAIELGVNLNGTRVRCHRFLDLDGDGAADLLHWRGFQRGWEWVRFMEAWDAGGQHNAQRLRSWPTSLWSPHQSYLTRSYVDTDLGDPAIIQSNATQPFPGEETSKVDPEIVDDGAQGPHRYRDVEVFVDPPVLVDVNGDGLEDVAWWDLRAGPQPVLYVQLNTGRGFGVRVEAFRIQQTMHQPPRIAAVFNRNGDGRQDLLLATIHAGEQPNSSLEIAGFFQVWGNESRCRYLSSAGNGVFIARSADGVPAYTFRNLAGPFPDQQQNNSAHWGWVDQVVALDSNGDGYEDVAYPYGHMIGGTTPQVYELAVNDRRNTSLLATVTNGLGRQRRITYRPLSDPVAYTAGPGCDYPLHAASPRRYVVSRVEEQQRPGEGFDNWIVYNYSYSDGVVHLGGRGDLFFGQRTVAENLSGTVITYTFNHRESLGVPEVYPYAGVPTRIVTETSVDQGRFSAPQKFKTVVDRHYETRLLHGGTVYAPILSSEVIDKSLDDALYLQSQARWIYPPLDAAFFGSPTRMDRQEQVLHFGEGNGPNPYVLSSTTTVDYLNNPGSWVVALPVRKRQRVQIGANASPWRTTDYAYAPNGLVRSMTVEPADARLRLEVRVERDLFGNVSVMRWIPAEGAPRSERVTYDGDGVFPVESENAVGHRTHFCYHAGLGGKTLERGPGHLVTTWLYDGFGRMLEERRPDGTRTEQVYSWKEGYPFIVTTSLFAADGTGGVTSIQYHDLQDRTVKEGTRLLRGGWSLLDHEFDARGRLIRTSLPYLEGAVPVGWTEHRYDSLDRLKETIGPDGLRSRIFYDRFTVTSEDRAGRQTTKVVAPDGQVMVDIDADGNRTTYEYDGGGRLVAVTDPKGNVTRVFYDALGRRTSMADPDFGQCWYRYDGYGRLIRKVHGGVTTTYQYDLLDRPTRRWTAQDGAATWSYDQGFPGELSEKRFAGSSTSYLYDRLGRPQQVTTRVDDRAFLLDFTYNAHGRLDVLTYPEGPDGARFAVKYLYDAYGRTKALAPADNPNRPYWFASKVDAQDRVTEEGFGNGLRTRFGFHPLKGYLESIATGANGAVLRFTHEYDDVGNLTRRRDLRTGIQERFTYDRLDRLQDWNLWGNGFAVADDYEYDELGNLTSKGGMRIEYGQGGARPHAAMRAGNRPLAYDARGNLTQGPGYRVGWTSYDKPAWIELEGGRRIDLRYDAQGDRIVKRGAVATTTYVEGVFELYQEGEKRVATFLLHGPSRVVGRVERERIGKGATVQRLRYHHDDHLGSIVAVTDEAGRAEYFRYDPFGGRRQQNGQPLVRAPGPGSQGFTEHEHDDEVGLINMKGRIFDPAFGRFLSADPLTRMASSAQGLNRYSYALNNPVRWVDPTGYQVEEPQEGGANPDIQPVNPPGDGGNGPTQEAELADGPFGGGEWVENETGRFHYDEQGRMDYYHYHGTNEDTMIVYGSPEAQGIDLLELGPKNDFEYDPIWMVASVAQQMTVRAPVAWYWTGVNFKAVMSLKALGWDVYGKPGISYGRAVFESIVRAAHRGLFTPKSFGAITPGRYAVGLPAIRSLPWSKVTQKVIFKELAAHGAGRFLRFGIHSALIQLSFELGWAIGRGIIESLDNPELDHARRFVRDPDEDFGRSLWRFWEWDGR